MDLSAKDDALQIDCNTCVFGDHRLELCYRQPRLYRIGVCLAVERLDLCAHPTRVRSCRLPRAFENAVTIRIERKMQRTWTQGTLSSMGASGCKGAGPASGAPASSPQLGACDISRRSWMSLSQSKNTKKRGRKRTLPAIWRELVRTNSPPPCAPPLSWHSWWQLVVAVRFRYPPTSPDRLRGAAASGTASGPFPRRFSQLAFCTLILSAAVSCTTGW